jgi:glycosyltransferase involved in cell wall biosynthesis
MLKKQMPFLNILAMFSRLPMRHNVEGNTLKEKPRVAFVAIAPFISGSERCLQIMVQNALIQGYRPILLLQKGSPMVQWGKAQQIPTYATNIHPLSCSNKLSWLFSQIYIALVLFFCKIKVVHSNQIWSFKAIDIPARLLGCKRICHFRDPIDQGSKWWLPNKPDTAIFISRYIQHQFEKFFGQKFCDHSTTLIDPIEDNSITGNSYRSQNLVDLKIKSGEAIIFGFIGQIRDVKGLAETIHILANIERKDWLLLVAGKDPEPGEPYLNLCKKIVEERKLEDKVIFLGFLERVSDFYKTIDVAIVLSKEEPLGLIPLEAAKYKKPSIVANVGGLPETVVDKVTGWIVDDDTVQQTIEAVFILEKNERAKIGAEAFNFINKTCNPENYFNSLHVHYESTL